MALTVNSKKKETVEIVKYNLDMALVKKLDETYKDFVLVPGNKDSEAMLMAGLRDYRKLRLKTVDTHKVLKSPFLEKCDFLDTKKREYLALIAPGENSLKAIRQAEDDRLAAIEKKRISEIKDLIKDIQAMGNNAYRHTVPELEKMKTHLETMEWEVPVFEEFLSDAQAAAYNAVISIKEAIETRIKLDKEKAERKAENERLEKIRKEQEAAQVKIDEANRKAVETQAKLEEQLYKIQEEKDKLAADKQAESDRKEREEFERQAKIKAGQEAKEKVEREKKAEQERIEAAEAEKKRQASLMPDKDKILGFCDILDQVIPPRCKDEKCNVILNTAMKGIYDITGKIRTEIEDL